MKRRELENQYECYLIMPPLKSMQSSKKNKANMLRTITYMHTHKGMPTHNYGRHAQIASLTHMCLCPISAHVASLTHIVGLKQLD